MPNQNLRNQKHGIGLLAQLVQSIWFTPRGSGVRIPQGPQTPQEIEEFFWLNLALGLMDFGSVPKLDQYQNLCLSKNVL